VAASSDDMLVIAAAAEQASEHPIARAIVEGARARGLALARATDVKVEPGGGLTARVGERVVRIGTRDFLALAGIAVDAAGTPGHTVSYVAIDDKFAGTLEVADPPAPAARASVAALGKLGIAPVMITGDHEAAANAVAREVGIERVHAGVRPTGKAAIVASLREHGPVAMVGDGINDAPALAAADLGIALGSGTDIAAAAADVTLLRGGIAALPTAFSLARATLHTIRRNLVAAFAYNVVCIPLAAGALYPVTGWQLSPVIASAAMSLSSISVLLSSLRLRGFHRA
jgi:Cu+-exporting ATPase